VRERRVKAKIGSCFVTFVQPYSCLFWQKSGFVVQVNPMYNCAKTAVNFNLIEKKSKVHSIYLYKCVGRCDGGRMLWLFILFCRLFCQNRIKNVVKVIWWHFIKSDCFVFVLNEIKFPRRGVCQNLWLNCMKRKHNAERLT
jgi:hypothetical protein